MVEQVGHWTIEGLTEEVALPDRYAGGGAVAAMSLAGAAATAELVFQLSQRRRGLSDAQVEGLAAAVSVTRELRARFLTEIDQDIASLTELMDAQRESRRARRSAPDAVPEAVTERMRLAVDAAIASPLRVADDATALLKQIEALRHLARPFTASDLGAAAATIQGAITSLILMAEVNLGMLDDQERAKRLRDEMERRSRNVDELATSIVSGTRRVIHGEVDQGE